MDIMKALKTIEQRDYIHSHLHQINETLINEFYQKIHFTIEKNNPVVGYDANGNEITKDQLISDIKEAEDQINRGEYITLEELKNESKTW